MSQAIYQFVHAGCRVFSGAVADVHVHNREALERPGTYIMAGNHLHLLDAPFAFGVTPSSKRFVPLAADKWRDKFLTRLFLDSVGAIYVNRGEVDRVALKSLLAALKAGHSLGIAPEGTRSTTGGLQQGKSGVCWLARAAGVPILPFAHWGIEQVRVGRRPRVQFVIGEPITVARQDDIDVKTDELMRRIAAMLPKQYRGVYATESANAGAQAAVRAEPPPEPRQPMLGV